MGIKSEDPRLLPIARKTVRKKRFILHRAEAVMRVAAS